MSIGAEAHSVMSSIVKRHAAFRADLGDSLTIRGCSERYLLSGGIPLAGNMASLPRGAVSSSFDQRLVGMMDTLHADAANPLRPVAAREAALDGIALLEDERRSLTRLLEPHAFTDRVSFAAVHHKAHDGFVDLSSRLRANDLAVAEAQRHIDQAALHDSIEARRAGVLALTGAGSLDAIAGMPADARIQQLVAERALLTHEHAAITAAEAGSAVAGAPESRTGIRAWLQHRSTPMMVGAGGAGAALGGVLSLLY